MPRMFDILKGKTERVQPEKKEIIPKKKDNLTVSFPRQIRDAFRVEKDPKNVFHISRKLLDAVKQKGVDSGKTAREKYNQTLGVAESLLGKVGRGEPLNEYIDEIYSTVDVLTNQLILGNNLLEYVVEEGTAENYLARHMINVCILSLAVGLRMRFNKSKLHTLGISAFFHDIGLLKVKHIIEQTGQLSEDQLKEVESHVSKSVDVFPEAENDYVVVKEIIKQHHERVNGDGYPLGLKGHKINDFSRILGLIDTYEALTHPRCFRKANVPHQAIKEIMHSMKTLFDPEVIKALVDNLSIYPVGSFVKLNNKEVAKVISSNPDSPLRPLVLILFDSYGKYISERETLDLSKSDAVYIKGPASLSLDRNKNYGKEGG